MANSSCPEIGKAQIYRSVFIFIQTVFFLFSPVWNWNFFSFCFHTVSSRFHSSFIFPFPPLSDLVDVFVLISDSGGHLLGSFSSPRLSVIRAFHCLHLCASNCLAMHGRLHLTYVSEANRQPQRRHTRYRVYQQDQFSLYSDQCLNQNRLAAVVDLRKAYERKQTEPLIGIEAHR